MLLVGGRAITFWRNLECLRQFSTLVDFVTKKYVLDKAAKSFGAYKNKSNHTNCPGVAPYYEKFVIRKGQ